MRRAGVPLGDDTKTQLRAWALVVGGVVLAAALLGVVVGPCLAERQKERRWREAVEAIGVNPDVLRRTGESYVDWQLRVDDIEKREAARSKAEAAELARRRAARDGAGRASRLKLVVPPGK